MTAAAGAASAVATAAAQRRGHPYHLRRHRRCRCRHRHLYAFCPSCDMSGTFLCCLLLQNNEWLLAQRIPYLPQCFRGTVIPWSSCFLLWLFSSCYLPYLLKKRSIFGFGDRTRLFSTKLMVSVFLVILSMVDLLCSFLSWQAGYATPIYLFISPSILIVTFCLACILQYVEFVKGVHSSGVFMVLWSCFFLFDLIAVASSFDHNHREYSTSQGVTSTVDRISFYVNTATVFLQLVLCLYVDRPSRSHDNSGYKELFTPDGFGSTERGSHQASGEKRKPCPEETCSFLSQITYSWILPLLIRGYRQPLTFDDLPDIHPADRATTIADIFEREWARQNIPKSSCSGPPKIDPSLLKTLIVAAWRPFLLAGATRLFTVFVEFLNPLLLAAVIDVLSADDPYYLWKGVVLAVALMLESTIFTVVNQLYLKYEYVCAMRARTAITATVYRKALRLSSQSRKTTSVGEIVNVMSVDAQKIHDTFGDIHEVWACPLTCVVAMFLLWQVVGPASLAGLVLIALMVPFSGYWQVQKFTKLQNEQMVHKDNRIRLINEILAGIKVLKMYAWEKSFMGSVDEARQKELASLRKQAYLHVAICITWFCAPALVSLAIFATYILSSEENYLDPSKAFVSLNIIQVLNFSTSFLAIWLAYVAQAFTSAGRIKRLLLEPDIDEDSVLQDHTMVEALKIKDATFSWDQDDEVEPALKNINLDILEGELVAVVGTVGSGKSSLISAMLGEINTINGDTRIKGSLAYVPQQAWVLNDTLQNNILFGKRLHDSKYQSVLEACALLPDLEILPAGDQTEIGEKGINLSGGQKQRVSLARAVYQNKDIYLFDDPLSAVDAHVTKHLFDRVIGPRGCLKNKTRVLVTHGVTYLPFVDNIVVLKDGEISETGTFQYLMERNGTFAEFVRQYLSEEAQSVTKDSCGMDRLDLCRQISQLSTDSTDWMGPAGEHPTTYSTRPSTRSRTQSMTSIELVDHLELEDIERQVENMRTNKLIEEESAQEGSIKLSVLSVLVRAAGCLAAVFLALALAANIAAITLTQMWLQAWTDDPVLANGDGRHQSEYRLWVYGLLTVFQMVSVGGIALVLQLGCLNVSKVLHSNLLQRILRAPMSFFDTTPLGRIINRFSTDMDKVDSTIAMYMRWFLFNATQVVATVIVISNSSPYFLIAVPIILAIFALIQRLYMRGVRQIKRIDSIRRSPIYVNMDETLVGVASVRAYQQHDRFVAKNDALIDNSQIAWYPVVICLRWLGLALQLMSTVVIFITIILVVLIRDSITPGVAALCVSVAMQLFWVVTMLVRGAAELENNIVSVERIKEYSEVPSEAEWVIEERRPDREWPQTGQVSLEHYSSRYREGLDLVLNDVSFTVSPREKVGIVGRTGAGKSSLALSLFRIVEAAGGRITIDGLDISKMGLHDVRSRLTIIPQDPVLFSGSLRRNLDPVGDYSTDQIWAALDLAHLRSFVTHRCQGLDYDCGDSGSALSVGQRQLVCLARALLRKSKILLLDEATAAVDLDTDELIQETIRTAFSDYTVLTIAHRINTILDYDRVLVLENGRIKEMGKPSELLQQPSSAFFALARDAGHFAKDA